MDTNQTDVASHGPSPRQQKQLTALIKATSLPLTEGYLIVSSPDVLKTCAYYVGTWCVEWMGDDWCWQPYSRDTDYERTFEEAKNQLESFLRLKDDGVGGFCC